MHQSGEFNGVDSDHELSGGVIDPSVMKGADGKLYLYYAKQSNQIWVGTLSAGWLAHVGGPRALIGVEGGATAAALVVICVVLVATRALSISRAGRGFAFALRSEELNLWHPEAAPARYREAAIHSALPWPSNRGRGLPGGGGAAR